MYKENAYHGLKSDHRVLRRSFIADGWEERISSGLNAQLPTKVLGPAAAMPTGRGANRFCVGAIPVNFAPAVSCDGS